MTIENLSIRESRQRFSTAFSNRFSILADNEEFPEIKTSGKPNSVNNHTEAVRNLHRILPYASVVKVNSNKASEEKKAKETMAQHKKY